MSDRKLGLLLGGICVLLVAGNTVLYMMGDHGKPEITFAGEAPAYAEGMSNEELLANVKASDDKDGDLTAKVVVDQVTTRSDGAKITYLVRDSEGNTATASQRLTGEGGAASAGAGTSDISDTEDETSEEKNSAAKTTAPTTTPKPTQSASEEDTETEDQDEQQETDRETDEETGIRTTPTPTATESPANPEAPVITLNTDKVTLKKGEHFSYAEYIEDFTDDKDSKSELGRNIQVNGADTSTTGTKEVSYHIVDSDGNRSEDAILTLEVE
ncbi:MAG: hypothetical protein EOM18_14485 [Clostridia bacterium]|nr:hypothetical protein [Clostridia bacterium]